MQTKTTDIQEVPIEIPYDRLTEDLLLSVVENFIDREGTDYGSVEVDHQTKINQVLKQIKSGETKIIFESKSETVTLITKNEFNKRLSKKS